MRNDREWARSGKLSARDIVKTMGRLRYQIVLEV